MTVSIPERQIVSESLYDKCVPKNYSKKTTKLENYFFCSDWAFAAFCKRYGINVTVFRLYEKTTGPEWYTIVCGVFNKKFSMERKNGIHLNKVEKNMCYFLFTNSATNLLQGAEDDHVMYLIKNPNKTPMVEDNTFRLRIIYVEVNEPIFVNVDSTDFVSDLKVQIEQILHGVYNIDVEPGIISLTYYDLVLIEDRTLREYGLLHDDEILARIWE